MLGCSSGLQQTLKGRVWTLYSSTSAVINNIKTSVSNVCPQLRSRVVVVKYDKKPLSNKTLFVHTEPFGVLREHLVLKNKVTTPSSRLMASCCSEHLPTLVFVTSGFPGDE